MTRWQYRRAKWACFWRHLGHDWDISVPDRIFRSIDRCRRCPKKLWFSTDGAWDVGFEAQQDSRVVRSTTR